MLKLINITKTYKYGKQSQLVLNNINLSFKTKELVFILGPSGSGKSTLLNIIGGLLTPDSGDIYLDEECLSKYSADQLNHYRNNMIGFIFQNYHLIEHMTVLDNLKICQNTPNYPKIDTILKQLNIFDKKHTEVSYLSGGEKERVAIARAIINDPAIILCDEPTGALDSINAQAVMEILKKLSKNRLVIIVSHDQHLAASYADRVITIKDGQINSPPVLDNTTFNKPKTSRINRLTIFKLALKNLLITKRRTILTAFATSIGIATILLIAFLSHGFNQEITALESSLVTKFPITIKDTTYELPQPIITSSTDEILVKNNSHYFHQNKITPEYLNYLQINNNYQDMLIHYDISLPIITDCYHNLDKTNLKLYPSNNYLSANYQLLSGTYPENIYDLVLQVDSNNNISQALADSLELPSEFSYETILGRQIKLPLNNDYYLQQNNYFYPQTNYQKLYHQSTITLTITGIVKERDIVDDNSYLLTHQNIINEVIANNQTSDIVQKQLTADTNLLSLSLSKPDLLSYLGYNSQPTQIDIYFANIKSKKNFLNYLDDYQESTIIYEDSMKDTINIVTTFINIITIILILFSIISLFVSSIMTSLLTNTRIMERIKEIGILRSLGASRKNIKNLFNVENVIISILSSSIAIIFVLLIKLPINTIINNYLGITNIYQINYPLILVIIILNMLLLVISGLIPATKASKLDIVECLRKN